MKRIVPFVLLLLTAAACDVYTNEPRYDVRDRLTGQFDVEEFSETYNDLSYYNVYITKSGYGNEVYIDNFYAARLTVRAIISYNSVTIPYQVVNGYEVEGSGTVYGTTLDVHYRVRDIYNNALADYCKTTFRRY